MNILVTSLTFVCIISCLNIYLFCLEEKMFQILTLANRRSLYLGLKDVFSYMDCILCHPRLWDLWGEITLHYVLSSVPGALTLRAHNMLILGNGAFMAPTQVFFLPKVFLMLSSSPWRNWPLPLPLSHSLTRSCTWLCCRRLWTEITSCLS